MVWLRRDLNRGANSNVDPETIPFEEGLINSVDRHLQELGFSNLCLRIANKFKDEIEKIAVEQKDIKIGIERLDHAITEHLAANDLVYEAVPAVIVIDDDDEEKQDRTGKSNPTPSTSATGITPSTKKPSAVVSKPSDLRDSSKGSKGTPNVATSSTPQTKASNVNQELGVATSAAGKGQVGVEGSNTQRLVAPEGSSAQRQVRSALSQKAEALAKRLSNEALLLRKTPEKQVAASGDARQNETGAISQARSGTQPSSLTTQVGTLSVSSPQWSQSSSVVARKRPGLLVGQDTHVQHTSPTSPSEGGATEGMNTRLRSKLPSGATNASTLGTLANDILKSKAYTLSDPILKLTPIPVPPSSQSQGTSSESSSKSDSITASPPSSPHSVSPPRVSPPPGSVGLRDFLSEGQTPSSLVQKAKETAKAKKLERYIIQFKEGLQVLGKPDKSDMWYPGIIEKVTPGRKGHDKYLVKFDCKRNKAIHGQLPVNHLAPVFYPDAPDLTVGSRVVATRPGDTVDSRLKNKSRDLAKAKADILFGGIIAELACEENKNRYLIFFDDGFAQYLSLRKLRHVVYASPNVWDDVSVHCRDFCKEYLQEYPYRPMVKLKAGETIQTEWNGKWLNAKVISLDCSLVKVIFDIDQRTEWIYRGSTRLEPLYTELERRDMVAAVQMARSASKARQKKKGRTEADEEEPEPEADVRIEDRITKPSFGVSKFSLKDPDGKEQWEDWEKEMSPREKEVQVAKALGMQRVTYGTSQNTQATATASPELVPCPPQSEADIPITTNTVESNSEETAESVASATSLDSGVKGKDPRPAVVVPAAIVRASPSVPKGPSPGSALTTSAVRASRSLRGKAPVIPYGEATRETEATWEAPWLKRRRRSQIPPEKVIATVQSDAGSREEQEESSMQVTAVARSRSTASLLQEKLTRNLGEDVPDSPPSENEAITTVFSIAPSIRGPHQCTPSCCSVPRLPEHERRKHNPLLIPLLSGWMRETAKRRPGYRRDVYYRTPCYRRLRSLSNVTQYLLETKTDAVTVDQFCFDPAVSCREFNPKMLHPRTRIEDLSHGKETVDISCVNENTNEYPPVVEYINKTIIADGVDLNLDREFLQCCDCTDLCQDKSKCSCCQLTVSASGAITGIRDENAGYAFRRLPECVTTGIYECNMRCKCASACFNRVVQNGIQARLQIFMTASKGWGLRCLDDIPKGAFICCYAGQILTEEMANKEGKDFGDEYLAELDHIEVVEQAKEGYESDVPELRDNAESERGGSEPTSEDGSSKDDFSFDDDSDTYSSCSDSSDSDQSYRPEEDFEPLLKRKRQEDTQPEVTLPTEISAKVPLEPQSGLPGHFGRSGFDVIDLTLDSEEEMDTTEETDISPPPVPKPLVKSSHESSLRHIIRRLVTCVSESKRVSSSDRSTSKPECERDLSTDAGSAVENSSSLPAASLNFPGFPAAETEEGQSSKALLPPEIPVERKADSANEAESKESNQSDPELLKSSEREEKPSLPTCPVPDTSMPPEDSANAVKSEDHPVEGDKVSATMNQAGVATTGKEAHGGILEAPGSDSPEELKSLPNTSSNQTNESGTVVKSEKGPESDKVDIVPGGVVDTTGHISKAELMDSETNTKSADLSCSLSGSIGGFSVDHKPVEASEWKGGEMASPLVTPRLPAGGKLITKKGSANLSALLGGAKKTRALALKSTGHKLFSSPRSSTGGHMLRKVMTLRPSPCAQGSDQNKTEGSRIENKQASTRLLYGEDSCYVIDAKSFGNAGRYLNHSCTPNLFVQNVFYETHDLRFPTVAFFALQNIPALQELTWDYSYDVGSVPGKVILCRCGAGECRGRLL